MTVNELIAALAKYASRAQVTFVIEGYDGPNTTRYTRNASVELFPGNQHAEPEIYVRINPNFGAP